MSDVYTELDLFEFILANQATVPQEQEDIIAVARERFKGTEPDVVTKNLIQNVTYSFKKILRKSLNESGCAQIGYVVREQATMLEPMWRAGLSVAWACEDRDEAIHIISSAYPGYDSESTIKKAKETEYDPVKQEKGAYSCATFDSLNPGLCANCPHKGKIEGPKYLGREVQQEEATIVEGELILRDGLPKEYPNGYFRGKYGGIYQRIREKGGDEFLDILVYPYDLYCAGRSHDRAKGDILDIVLRLPHDEVRKFAMTTSELQQRESARVTLGKHGVMVPIAQMEKIVVYITNWGDLLQKKQKAEHLHTQMGWTKDDTFILGDQEITKEKSIYVPPSKETAELADVIGQKGTIEEWDKVIRTYARPGLELQAFMIMLGFGVPLFKFYGNLEGGIFNLISKESGTGKSTLLAAINSIYGDPTRLLLLWKDTFNSLEISLAARNNLPACIDEVTNWTPQNCSQFAYSVPTGRGKERASRDSNTNRVNYIYWRLVTICTSNLSLYEKIAQEKISFEGERYRIFEVTAKPTEMLNKEVADLLFPKLCDNYGIAGSKFLQFLVRYREECKERLFEIRRKFDKAANVSNTERYWSAMIACGLTGGYIAQKELGLLQGFDLDRVFEFMLNTIQRVRGATAFSILNPIEILGTYLNKMAYNNTLIIDGNTDRRSSTTTNLAPAFYRQPKGALLARYEPDTERAFITLKDFRMFCGEMKANFSDVSSQLLNRGVLVRSIKKRLGKGTFFNPPAVDVYELDMAHSAIKSEVEDLLDLKKQDETSSNETEAPNNAE